MSLLDTLKDNLTGDAIGKLAAKIGVDPEQARSAINSALPTIVSALAKNSQSAAGAASLDKAVDQHDGGIMAKLQASAPDLLAEGQKILGHVFGPKQAAAQGQVAAAATGSGLDLAKIGELLAGLAPVVMSALNSKKKAEGLDAAGVAASLQADGDKAKQEAMGSPSGLLPEAGGALSFLDADGDGDVMDDLAEKGKGLLGSLGGLGGLFGGGDAEKKG